MRGRGQRSGARAAWLVAVVLASGASGASGCGGSRHDARVPAGSGTGTGTGTGSGSGSAATVADEGLAPDEGADDGPPLEERIAAIEHAMNDLAPVANQCWAAAAAEDLHVEGAVRMLVTVARTEGVRATVTATLDEPGRPTLVRCLTEVLATYAWAPPVRGQTIELPFAFRAPPMQNVIDRRLVPHHAQAGVDVAVLLDVLNTANAAVSLVEVAIQPGRAIGPRVTDRVELWTFLGPARVTWGAGASTATADVERGDALWVPVGARVQIEPPASAPGGLPPMIGEALVAFVPGGREGVARAGALPGVITGLPARAVAPAPIVVRGASGRRFPRPGGAATILVEPGVPDRAIGAEASLLTLELEAGAVVPSHVHDAATEVLYVTGGGGTMTVGGVTVPVTEDSVIQIPPGVEHAFTAAEATTAFQLYTPAGPEQRFKPAAPAAKPAKPAKKKP